MSKKVRPNYYRRKHQQVPVVDAAASAPAPESVNTKSNKNKKED